MVKSKLGVADESKTLCPDLLEKQQTFPENALFRDDLFEARIIQAISSLIVPSAKSLATYGAEHLEILAESVNEG